MIAALYPVYQPIVDLHTGSVLYYEALARVQGDAEGLAHREIIANGEKRRMMHLFDASMVAQVIAALKIHPEAHFGINLSVCTLEEAAWVVLEQIKRPDLARRLVLEITETVEVTKLDVLEDAMERLRRLGVRWALDDFGDGFCTPAVVRRIRPEILKIGGTLVARAHAAGNGSLLTEALSLTREVGAVLVAEHIDTADKLSFIRALGIDFAQGDEVGQTRREVAHQK